MIDKDVEALNKETAIDLKRIASDPEVRKISRLSLPQIDAVIEEIIGLLPGNDLPTFILRGLTALPEHHVPTNRVAKDTALLSSAWKRIKKMAVFGTFFAGPAAAILLYQKLLQLAGRTADLAFPEGYWQFYVDYALREDAARHTHETAGFDRLLRRHNLQLTRVDRLTAWAMAAIEILFEYPLILRNEWRERVYLKTLVDVVGPDHELTQRIKSAVRSWNQHRPYRRGPDVLPGEGYPHYRQRKFDEFLSVYLAQLDDSIRKRWLDEVQAQKEGDLPAYIEQMSIRSTLTPGHYFDQREPLDLTACRLGLIIEGVYYLVPVTRPMARERPDVTTVRSQIAAILTEPGRGVTADLTILARTPRADLGKRLSQGDQAFQVAIDQLKTVPMIINCDRRENRRSLAEIRQGERGIGFHPVTLFDTGETAVFDLSHIYFDGIWGAAFAEMMTTAATAWAVYLHTLPPIHPPVPRPVPLNFGETFSRFDPPSKRLDILMEAGAETDQVHLRNLLALRRVFKLRNDLIRLTVNDIMVLYRAIHAYTYRPSDQTEQGVAELSKQSRRLATAADLIKRELNEAGRINPTMLIPVDATRQNPGDRVYPLCFQVPIQELGLIELHRDVIDALDEYHRLGQNRGAAYERFDQLQRHYLGLLAGLGVVFAEAKRSAAKGETISVHTIKLLAHLPRPMQQLLDRIPNRVEMINHLIKGQEVFSNIGVVANASSLVRFLSAKDDNPGKRMAWGVLTDAQLTMRITLRDFRPHVPLLFQAGEGALAHALTADYLLSYTQGLNRFVTDLRRMTMASRETRLASDLGLVDVHPA